MFECIRRHRVIKGPEPDGEDIETVKENFRVYTLPLWYVLREHTKAELLEICRTQGIRKVSKLKKDELVATMVADLPLMVAEKMIYWDQPTYDLMEYIVMEDSFYPCDPDAPGNVEAYFLEESIGFTFEIETEGQWFNTLIVPKDFQHVFLLLLGNEEYQEDIKVNTKILRLAKGLLHYYGVLTPEELARFLNNLLDKPLDAHEIATVVAEMGSYTWGINWDGDQFSDGQMLNLPYVLNERENYRDLEHRQLTHDKIWQAGEPGFSQLTPEMQALADFIWGTKPKEGKAELIDALFGILQSNLQPTEILPGMVKFLELESKREVSKLALLLFDYYNNIPLWILKGHTPAQLGQHSIDDAQTSVAKKKVGRNDPCPCESGRKFKRCCGKN